MTSDQHQAEIAYVVLHGGVYDEAEAHVLGVRLTLTDAEALLDSFKAELSPYDRSANAPYWIEDHPLSGLRSKDARDLRFDERKKP